MLPPASAPTPRETLRVLTLDDEPLWRHAIQPPLIRMGFRREAITAAAKAEEALAVLRRGVTDLFIGDLVLVGDTRFGQEVIADAVSRDVPTVVVTGTGPEAAPNDLPVDPRLIVGKPFDEEDLEAAIGFAFQLPRQRERAAAILRQEQEARERAARPFATSPDPGLSSHVVQLPDAPAWMRGGQPSAPSGRPADGSVRFPRLAAALQRLTQRHR